MKFDSSCLIIAGEKSGEDHALTFLPELMAKNPNCLFYGVGGDPLRSLGVETMYDLEEFSGIGISEVIGKVPFYYKALSNILKTVRKNNTKTAILIDFQTFNLKLARKLKKLDIKVLYYVAPQAWVWKEYRTKVLEKCVHTLFTILPFEKKWFQDRGVTKVKGVLHPLMTEHAEKLKSPIKRIDHRPSKEKTKVLLLPGSRNIEIERLLPIFSDAIKLLEEDGYRFEIGIVKVSHVNEDKYNCLEHIEHVWDNTKLVDAIEWADMCAASSGTVTLTTGLFELPTVVGYKLSPLSEFIFSSLVNYTGFISLTNIIHGTQVFPEFTQYHCNRYNISKSFRKWIDNRDSYIDTIKILESTKKKLKGDDFNLVEYMDKVMKEGR